MSDHTPGAVLFCSISSRGQLNPLLTIAKELAARGRSDLWFASDATVRPDVEALGGESPIRFVDLGAPIRRVTPSLWDDAAYAATTSPSRWRGYVAFIRETLDVESFTEKYRALDAEVARVRPSLMVVDAATVYGIEVAMTRGIPFVLSVPYPLSGLFLPRLPKSYPTPFSGLPRDMTRGQRIRNRLFRARFLTLPFQRGVAKQAMAFVESRKKLGIVNPTGDVGARIDAATAIFAYSVFGLEYPFPVPDKVRMLGAVVPPLPEAPGDDGLRRWLDERESVVFMNFGTIARPSAAQITALVEVARRLGPDRAVLWKLSEAQRELLPPERLLPDNLRIESWVSSQFDVLAHPHVRAFVCHGGGNSVSEGLSFGKPMVVLPLWLDCHDLAVRVADSGAGLAVPDTGLADAAAIGDRLARVLDEPGFTERALSVGRSLREAGGAPRAAELIAEYADRVAVTV
ncbi:glycosyltransferase [Streptomyces radicis]|uniref:Glycosyltransferase n=1 Tax=Streptomyces radicis TaxID=1750517 RepID=A0A3A9VV97_9ACTN|nr:glycosyltransferase [Streptomyces radicis]RKN04699.1 glycosyltransferase [Streptomyces radicis]RKN15631.1 glycosyltransferase [Streptomyces radicis]